MKIGLKALCLLAIFSCSSTVLPVDRPNVFCKLNACVVAVVLAFVAGVCLEHRITMGQGPKVMDHELFKKLLAQSTQSTEVVRPDGSVCKGHSCIGDEIIPFKDIKDSFEL